MKIAPSFDHLSNSELTAELTRLVAAEREATVLLIASLGEFDRRQLYLPAGFNSLFSYCREKLHLGDGAAYRRIESARAAQRFPVILDRLANGQISLTAVSLVAQHLTAANHLAVLDQVAHKRTREVERIVAGLKPKPDAPTLIRKVPAAKPGENVPVAPSVEEAAAEETAAFLVVPAPAARPVIAPLTPERFKLQITMDRATHDTLREIQDLIRHSVPSGDAAIIVARALVLLREQLLRQKAAVVKRPRKRKTKAAGNNAEVKSCEGGAPFELSEPPRSRAIEADVKREVWARDGGRCAFIGTEGRCMERGFLEFHHLDPFGAGGPSDLGNIELRCRAHNGYESHVFFGAAVAGRGR